MNKEVIKRFRNLLYPNHEEVEELDESETKKVIYEALREVLKSKDYQFAIGSYLLDVTPKNLSVIYETPDTRIEVSNRDVHFETTRQTPARFFVISSTAKEKYDPNKTPYIIVTGEILHYDNIVTNETYSITLVAENENDKIQNYLKLPEDSRLHEDEMLDSSKTVAVCRDIKVSDKRTDVGIFFNPEKVRPVEYDYRNDIFIPFEYKETKDYKLLVPNLSKKKKVISTIYSTIIDFYNEYLNREGK